MAYNRKEEYLAVVKQPKEISDTLLETIDYIAKARDAELSFDKTIIAEIVSLNNADTGEYFVEYQKGKFRAYAPVGLTYVYSKGTNVYVKIPGGDFTQKKTIEGKVSATSQTEEEYTALTQQIIDISEIFTDGNEYGVLAYAQPPTEEVPSDYYEQVIYENKEMSEDITFTSLLNTYPNIMISADFRTNFYGTTVAGNYGLKVELEEKETGITYIRYLDITNFSGSIYGYDIYSPQYVIYDLSGLDLIGIKKITFFQDRFLHYDEVKNSNDEIIKVYDTKPNIFVKNIKIKFIDLQDSSKDLYYIGISAPQGLSLIQETDKIKLTGVLYYANKDIMDQKNCKCYWYKLNPAILTGDEKYEQMAGPGWENISDSSNISFNILTVSGKDVYQQMWYKLIVVYNNSTTLSKEIRVVKYYNERFTLIRKDNSDTDVKLTIVDSQSKVEKADWYVDLLDGSYQLLATDTSEIDINQYLTYGDVIFYTVSKIDNGYVPCRYQLKTYIQDSPVRIIFDGNDTFQYDKNGSITYDQSVAEFIIKPNITVDKENIGIKSITWYSPDGGELVEYPTTKISNSMLTKLWIDKSTNSVHFNIRQKFLSNYTNNTLSLKIITLADKEFLFTKSIIFISAGEYNINGLDYSLVSLQCDENGNEIKFRPLNKNSDGSYTPIYFKPVLRLNGNIIKDGYAYQGITEEEKKVYKISISAEGINTNCEVNKDIIKIDNITEDSEGQYFVRILVSVGVGEAKNKKCLTYYQPVAVSENIDYQKIGSYNIPSKIIYYSDNTISYSSTQKLSFMYNNVQMVSGLIKSLNDNIFINVNTIDEDDYKYYLVPSTEFTGAYFAKSTDTVKTKPMGAIILFTADLTADIIYPIVMLNSRDSLMSDVSDDDGTEVSVVDEDNPEETKPLLPWLAKGDFNKDNGSTIIGEGWARKEKKSDISTYSVEPEEGKYVSGFYQYDVDGVPTNTIRSDGVVRFGGDKLIINNSGIELKEDVDTNILTIAKLLNEIANNTELKNQLSDYIAPKNIKLKTWYVEE